MKVVSVLCVAYHTPHQLISSVSRDNTNTTQLKTDIFKSFNCGSCYGMY